MSVIKFMKIPDEFSSTIDIIFNEAEKAFIEKMKEQELLSLEIEELLKSNSLFNDLSLNYLYRRGIVDIVSADKYKIGSFYTLTPYVSQYEPEIWEKISIDIRNEIYEWQLLEYEKYIVNDLKVLDDGKAINDLYYMTLDETYKRIDEIEEDLYIQPCNCTTLNSSNDRLKNVCIQFGLDFNYPNHRGLGERISKAEAKKIVKEANKSGLMQLCEHNAICNCDAKSCYPSNLSKKLNLRKRWPKSRCDIKFDDKKCITCNKCVSICNFNAFTNEGNKITFNESKCYGCSICISGCPVSAISM